MIDNDGSYRYSKEVDVKIIHPDDYVLFQNFPNPFNNSTMIKYYIPIRSLVQIIIYNSVGQKVGELINGIKSKGLYEQLINAEKLPSGTYFLTLKCNSVESKHIYYQIIKILVVK